MRITDNGYSFSVEALTVLLAKECKDRGIETRAQALTAWNGYTANQRSKFLGELIIGAMKFPGEPDQIDPYEA